MKLSNKRVLLVGVSKGLGAATAYTLLKEGARVAISGRDEKKLRELAGMLSKYGKVITLKGDASTPRGAKSIVSRALRHMRGIDHLAVLVGGYMEDDIKTLSALEPMLMNHIKVPLYVANAAVTHMHKGSSIVLISAATALESYIGPISYSISKAGTAKAIHVLAGELLSKGIRVNGIAPYSISGEFKPEREWRSLRKLGDYEAPPEDFASVIAWLMTDEAGWIDGVVIPVDGGTRFRD